MALTRSSLSNIPTCFASCSIGCKSSHTLPKKLEAIAAAGFSAIELSFPDILSFGSQHLGKDIDPYDYDSLCKIGEEIRKLCQDHGLKILILQPFANFEGWPKGSKEREDAFTRAKGWIRIMQAVGTDMLQVGSTDSPNLKPSQEEVAADLRELADLLAPHSFRIAYENWCWSSHAPGWLEVWQIVQKVDRPNVGLCLDTFQTAGGEWADPTTLSGLNELEGEHLGGRELLSVIFHESLDKLSKTVPKDKIYFLQISDAYKPKEPFENKTIDGLRPRGRWSHDFRPVPFNGGYLPVVDVAKAVLKTGFRGYFSMEVFDGGPNGKGKDYELEDFAKEAMESHKKLLDACAE
ncbi:xylose isomerase-like protein [Xylona heveae TC161]|uniref:Xylose isomerase-like protein n=1 Tax=Xylona heveae (strain CBS 132557 / TC161) TaxID=1328760 RepID=A0A165JYV9_XYLHT|nr:xylose isomerase-like protein [Xylona heveae TC161]KZF26802.1 xylose isomerase-like protein [Xylona heveae TC161]